MFTATAQQMTNTLVIRTARLADLAEIEALRRHSAKALTGTHYAETALDAALAVGELDRQMIGAGTFFVARLQTALLGAAAWLPRTDRPEIAVVRSVYIHPHSAGTGLGRRLMAHVERHACQAGHCRFELQSSLSAEGFYLRLGYQVAGPRLASLCNGVSLPVVQMQKKVPGIGFDRSDERAEHRSDQAQRSMMDGTGEVLYSVFA